MSFFKKLFAKVAPSADLTQIDEKAEADFNKAFADLVTEQVSAVATAFEDRVKALENKETPAFDASELSAKIEALETAKAEAVNKLTEALAIANTDLKALKSELADVKLGKTAITATDNSFNAPPSSAEVEMPFIQI